MFAKSYGAYWNLDDLLQYGGGEMIKHEIRDLETNRVQRGFELVLGRLYF